MSQKHFFQFIFALFIAFSASAQEHGHAPESHTADTMVHAQGTVDHAEHAEAAGSHAEEGHAHAEYDPAGTAIHHISDANVYSILDFVRIPLPMILYAPTEGWDVFYPIISPRPPRRWPHGI